MTYGDVGSRDTLQVQGSTEDFKELARTVTDSILKSPMARGWNSSGKKPRLVVGDLVNNTDDESIRMRDVHAIIQSKLLQSGTVRIVDRSATDFEYIVRTWLTSTHQYGTEGEELYHLTLRTRVAGIDGEVAGEWSHEVKKLTKKRRVF